MRTAPNPAWPAFLAGMRELGYEEGRNLEIVPRFAADRVDRLEALAAELVALKPDVIFAESTPAAAAAKRATATIPIVIPSSGDAVGSGLVASLARPGGNVTGLQFLGPESAPKLIQLLHELVPRATRLAFVGSSQWAPEPLFFKQIQAVERATGVSAWFADYPDAGNLDRIFTDLVRERTEALIVAPGLFINVRVRFAALAAQHRLPAIYMRREFVDAGGLLSYGASFPDLFRRAATYVDRLLKGAKPGDLPVEQPTKFELVLNLKAAAALGLTVPPSLLLRTDEVIR